MSTLSVDLFQVMTFATDPLSGNPAFVLSETEGADLALAGACDCLGAGRDTVTFRLANGDRRMAQVMAVTVPH